MAVEKKLNQDNNQQSMGGQQTPTMGGAAGATGITPVNTTTGRPASSGRFTNTSAYLQANQGAGQKIANAVSGTVTKDLTKAEKQTSDINKNIGDAVAAERNRLAQASSFAQQVNEDPTKITQNEPQLGEFRKLYNNANVAAQQEQMLQQQSLAAQQALQTAGQTAGNLSTEQGRIQALQKTLARPSYTQGQQTLDQLLFQVGGAEQLNRTRQDALNRVAAAQRSQEDNISKFLQDISTNKTQELEASNLLKGLVSSNIGNFQTAQTEEAIKASAENARLNEAYRQYLLGNTSSLNPADLSKIKNDLGLSDNFKTYGVTRGDAYKDYLQNMRTDLTAQDVVDANELARIQALNLLGNTTSAFTQVGDRGPLTGIDASKLSSAAQASREKLMADMAAKQGGLVAGGGQFYDYVNTGYDISGLDKIIKAIEAADTGADLGMNVTDYRTRYTTPFGYTAPSNIVAGQVREVADSPSGNNMIAANNSGTTLGAWSNDGRAAGDTKIRLDSSGNLVSGQTNQFTGVNQEALANIQNYINNLLNQAGYFDELGKGQQTDSLFGKLVKTQV